MNLASLANGYHIVAPRARASARTRAERASHGERQRALAPRERSERPAPTIVRELAPTRVRPLAPTIVSTFAPTNVSPPRTDRREPPRTDTQSDAILRC